MKYTAALTPQKYLSTEEQARLLVTLEKFRDTSVLDLRNSTMLMFMLRTGARPGETLNLTWGDINLTDKSVLIKTTKGGPTRVIPLNFNLCHRFRAMKRGRDEERIFKICRFMLIKVWGQYRPCKKTAHSLRHTFAANFYKASRYNIWLTQQALGHVKLTSTAVYMQIQANIEDFRKAIGA